MNIYKQISDIIPTLHGWCEVPKAITLANLVLAIKPNVALEVGVWGGRSAFPMLMACRQLNKGKVICVDPWSSAASVEGQQNEKDKEWWAQTANHELVYKSFRDNLLILGLERFADVRRIRSDEFNPPPIIELAHVDGNHGIQALKDVQKIVPSIPIGGVCVLDDLHWTGGAVEQSADYLRSHGFIELHGLGTGAVFLRL